MRAMNKSVKNLVCMVNQRLLNMAKEGMTYQEIIGSDLFVIISAFLSSENMYHGFNYYIYDQSGILRLAGRETNIIQFYVR